MADQNSPDEKPSSVSSKGTRSSRISVSSAAALARAKAEAAQARVSFAAKQLEIKKEKVRLQAEAATLEATLEALHVEEEAAAATAEAEILEAAAAEEADHHSSARRSSPSRQSTHRRTSEYVQNQARIKSDSLSSGSLHENTESSPPAQHEVTQVNHSRCTDEAQFSVVDEWTSGEEFHLLPSIPLRPVPQSTAPNGLDSNHANDQHINNQIQSQSNMMMNKPSYQTPIQSQSKMMMSKPSYQTPGQSQPNVTMSKQSPIQSEPKVTFSKPAWQPSIHSQPSQHDHTQTTHAQTPNMTDFAQYLARRELVNTGLTKFDDRPESFRAWESSFFNATGGLGLSASEELDLLSSWLGKESSVHAHRIRSVYINNPITALTMVWARLRECYCAPEVIEQALFNKLDNFPKIGNRDYSKLRELGDLLMELMAAKADGYLPGLSYLDTPRGINPIVEKLSHPLQEKWISVGSRFKEDNRCFPPFHFFAHFIYREAQIRNDPAFALSSFSSGPSKYEKSMSGYGNTRMPISVHKIDLGATTDSSTDAAKEEEDPGKQCPIHLKPHPLAKCRDFRNQTIDERKSYLKDRGICFRCCASVSHIARDCRTVLRCRECNSERHSTAMHPSPASETSKPPIEEPQPDDEDNGTSITTPSVSSFCTEVCGHSFTGQSCSKICLVRVYPQGQRDRSVNTYAIIDDQSNRSFARPDLFDIFSIKSSRAPYSMRTCAGHLEMVGRKAEGFCVEAISGGVAIDLPPLIECSEIPNNRLEIPTPEAALHHAHLKPIAPHIPALNTKAQILLLLGRDVVRVHKAREQINGPHDAPFAQRLDLGWVLVGDVCLGEVHKPEICTFKTNVLESRKPSFLTPCPSLILMRERASYGGEQQGAFYHTAWGYSANMDEPKTVKPKPLVIRNTMSKSASTMTCPPAKKLAQSVQKASCSTAAQPLMLSQPFTDPLQQPHSLISASPTYAHRAGLFHPNKVQSQPAAHVILNGPLKQQSLHKRSFHSASQKPNTSRIHGLSPKEPTSSSRPISSPQKPDLSGSSGQTPGQLRKRKKEHHSEVKGHMEPMEPASPKKCNGSTLLSKG